MPIQAPDLTKSPPRSPRVRLGGYPILPRMLDKGRATLAGTQGEYSFGCPTDERFLDFVGVTADALKAQLAQGKGDWETLQWVQANGTHQRGPSEIAAWAAWADGVAPETVEGRAFYNEVVAKIGPERTDLVTWFDMLDLDDYVSFGGRA
jgi:hypothetical protein